MDNEQNKEQNSPLIVGDNIQETTKDNIQESADNKHNNVVDINSNKGMKKNPKYNNLDILTTEEARKRGSNGGKKSGEVRKAKKTMRETIINMISQEVDPDKLASMGVDIDSLGGDYTYQAAIIAAMLREAVNGDTKAMALLRDTMGEQPALHTVNQTEIITKEDMKTIDNLKQYLTG